MPLRLNGSRHFKSALYHPSTNGLAERAIHTVKRGLRKMEGESLEEKLSKFQEHTTFHDCNLSIRGSGTTFAIAPGFTPSRFTRQSEK